MARDAQFDYIELALHLLFVFSSRLEITETNFRFLTGLDYFIFKERTSPHSLVSE